MCSIWVKCRVLSSHILLYIPGVVDPTIPSNKIRPCYLSYNDTASFLAGRRCPPGQLCMNANISHWLGPNDGITTFDDIFLSMLTVFQCITLEGWSEIYWLVSDPHYWTHPWESYAIPAVSSQPQVEPTAQIIIILNVS